MRSLSICYISQTFGMGGAETFVSELLSELQQNKYTVSSYTNHRSFQQLLQKEGIVSRHIPVEIDIIGDWKGLLKAVALLPAAWVIYGIIVWRERERDVFLVSGFAEKLFVSWWAYLLGVRVVWIEFAPLSTLFKKFLGVPRFWYKLAARFTDTVITSSRHSQRGLLSENLLKKEQLTMIPCGRRIQRKSITVLSKKPEIVCISRMEKGKGQDVLVHIFALVLKKVPRAHLTLVGEGSFLPTVRHLAKKLRVQDSITFMGRVPDALEILAKARVCAVPSIWPLEGFGLVACEGMALGKAVVAFDHGPGNEIILHNETGLLAPDGNLQAFADDIIRLLTNDNLANTLGSDGRQRFLEHYTMERVARKYGRLLQKVCR
ncbi:MAG: glycosyltransferase family 4 protein [bacterium]|nr:glycosyltransferase family 4 protein [bacterium]